MIVSAVQFAVRKHDKLYNLEKVKSLINRQADLFVLPELFSTGYWFPSREIIADVAEPVPGGPTTKAMCEMARRKRCHITGAIAESDGGALYITAVLAGPCGYVGKHRKRHLTEWEKQNYQYGTDSEVFNIGGCKVGLMVCLEGWYPESARELTLKGAELICHSMLTLQQRTLDVLRVRAMENHVFIAAANSCGEEEYDGGRVVFRGDSRIIDENGNILASAGAAEKTVTAHIDPAAAVKDLEDCRDLSFEALKHKGTMYR